MLKLKNLFFLFTPDPFYKRPPSPKTKNLWVITFYPHSPNGILFTKSKHNFQKALNFLIHVPNRKKYLIKGAPCNSLRKVSILNLNFL